MADTATDANMKRSSALQKEWNTLRDEMEKLVLTMTRSSTQKQRDRKAVITERMTAITAEMSVVLASAKEKLPPDDIIENSEPPVYSPRNRHRVERTYDSSDSEGPPPSRAACNIAAPAPCVTVESPTSRVRKELTVRTTLGTKLRSTVRKAESPKAAQPTATLSAEERESLKLEESRLEREARRLRREERNGDENANARADEVAARLKEITDLRLDIPAPSTIDDNKSPPSRAAKAAKQLLDAARSPRRWGGDSKSPKPPTSASSSTTAASLTSPTDDSESLSDLKVPHQGDSKENCDGAAKKQSKRKGWSGVRAALGKKMMGSSPGVRKKGDGKEDIVSPVSLADATRDITDGNEFTQTRDRLVQRGERLGGLAEDAEGMREGASDMLAATRALRQKKAKKGIFS